MDAGNFTRIVIAAVMMIVIVMVVVVPVLQTAEYDQLGDNSPTGYATATIKPGVYTTTATGYAIDGAEASPVGSGSGSWVLLSDNLAVLRYDASYFSVIDYSGGSRSSASALTVTTTTVSWTSGGETVTKTIGGNAVERSSTGELGVYDNANFKIDKDKQMIGYVQTNSFTYDGGSSAARLVMRGTADSLSTSKLCLLSGGNYSFPSGSATATISDGYIGNPNDVYWSVAAGPTLDVSITTGGSTITTAAGATVFVAPTQYTDVTDAANPIKSMLDIVPLLMIVGVITMLIAVAIVRR